MKYNENMKKMCSILLIFVFFNYPIICNQKTNSYENKTQYAKALDNCVLYKSIEMKDDFDDVYFFVPESYFVVVLGCVNEECFKVQYDKYIGYVKVSCIILAKFTPIVKTLNNITLDIKETAGTQIWNKPTTSGLVLTTVPAGFKDVNYISKTVGSIPYGGESNIWYYVSYVPFKNSTSVYEGYIYSENTTNLSEIIYNAETNADIQENEFNENNNLLNVSSTIKTIIVALISIPIILFFVVILYKIVKKIKDNTNKRNFQNNSIVENINDYDNVNFKNNDELKLKINQMKSQVYIKQNKSSVSGENSPKFPYYDSEDDLL